MRKGRSQQQNYDFGTKGIFHFVKYCYYTVNKRSWTLNPFTGYWIYLLFNNFVKFIIITRDLCYVMYERELERLFCNQK